MKQTDIRMRRSRDVGTALTAAAVFSRIGATRTHLRLCSFLAIGAAVMLVTLTIYHFAGDDANAADMEFLLQGRQQHRHVDDGDPITGPQFAADPTAEAESVASAHNISWPKTLVFSINAGRSGSRFLANLIGSTGNAVSYHEPYQCHVLNDPGLWEKSYERRRLELLPWLWGTLERMTADTRVFAMTCPNFKAKLHDVFMNALLQQNCSIKVVVLRRYLPAVTKSLANIGWYSESHPMSCLWCRSSNWVNSFVGSPATDKQMTQLERLTSYAVSTEAFAQAFAEKYKSEPKVEIIEVRTEELFTKPEVSSALLQRIGLSPTESTKRVITGAVTDKLS